VSFAGGGSCPGLHAERIWAAVTGRMQVRHALARATASSRSNRSFRVAVLALVFACHDPHAARSSTVARQTPAPAAKPVVTRNEPSLPLTWLADVDLPGNAVRFDYQDIDPAKKHLVIAHMNDSSVVVVNLDGSVVKVLPDIPTARGVIVADDVGKIFITSSPNQLVIIDNDTLAEVSRVPTGKSPDGVGWDPKHRIVGVSDQGDGAISLIADAGIGRRRQIVLGSETGNVAFDPARGIFWITTVMDAPPDQLVGVDPTAARVTEKIPLPGCQGAHGLRIHPDGKSALIACERNDQLLRVSLDGSHAVALGRTGAGPDVMSIDAELGWLYVAAESGDLTVFDLTRPGVHRLGQDHPGSNAHSVAVDPVTHRVFFPLVRGPQGTPVLRIMQPSSRGQKD
jgi:sugar lactone lactonase YvrE